MKRSFDYFKTLKEMSDKVCCIFNAVKSSGDIKKDILIFYGIRSELSKNLADEFVAPIERNDIYNLSFSLCREVEILNNLSYIYSDEISCVCFDDITESLKKCGDCIIALSDKRFYGKLLSGVAETRVSNSRVKKELLGLIPSALNSGNKALKKYALTENMIKFSECVDNTFSEIERVIINNS